MSDEPRQREDHLVEPLLDALRDHPPREEPQAFGRGSSWLIVVTIVVTALLVYAWLA